MSFRPAGLSLATIVFLAFLPAACGKKEAPATVPVPAQPAAETAPAVQADPVCKEGSQLQHPNGKLKACLLPQDWTTGPYTCRVNWSVVLHPDGKLKECKFAGTATFDGLVV